MVKRALNGPDVTAAETRLWTRFKEQTFANKRCVTVPDMMRVLMFLNSTHIRGDLAAIRVPPPSGSNAIADTTVMVSGGGVEFYNARREAQLLEHMSPERVEELLKIRAASAAAALGMRNLTPTPAKELEQMWKDAVSICNDMRNRAVDLGVILPANDDATRSILCERLKGIHHAPHAHARTMHTHDIRTRSTSLFRYIYNK